LSATSISKTEFAGVSLPAVHRGAARVSCNFKKTVTKTPLGPSGGTKFRDGKDAGGSPAKGKGVYQFTKKYGANVDGYSPIYTPEVWSTSGDTYQPGPGALALWALLFAGLLAGSAALIIGTSAL
jgi:photosystem II protein